MQRESANDVLTDDQAPQLPAASAFRSLARSQERVSCVRSMPTNRPLPTARARWVLWIYLGIGLRGLAIAQPAPLPKDLDDYVAGTIKEWNIPGAALAVVKDGKPVVVKGYGITKLGTSD